jgi:hypothetical protein
VRPVAVGRCSKVPLTSIMMEVILWVLVLSYLTFKETFWSWFIEWKT